MNYNIVVSMNLDDGWGGNFDDDDERQGSRRKGFPVYIDEEEK